jgi:hypothetical protein
MLILLIVDGLLAILSWFWSETVRERCESTCGGSRASRPAISAAQGASRVWRSLDHFLVFGMPSDRPAPSFSTLLQRSTARCAIR